MGSDRTWANNPKTKIVCTLGPSTESEEVIQALVENGMSVARLNLSHGTLDSHTVAIDRVRHVSKSLGTPVGIMVDVPGPKYRIGPVAPGAVELAPGDRLTLTSENVIGTRELLSVVPPGIHRDAVEGSAIMVDDGQIELRALEIKGAEVLCQVVIGGRITERRGVATPGKSPSQPFPDKKAVEALKFAVEQEADFVALSTINSESEVKRAREILETNGQEAYIISKIERAEALNNFEGILAASDAIMVARGDMGVELPLAQVPMIQKKLISLSNLAGKPVITATQMLESMIRSYSPTRAEVADVANAIFDGTDAVMLSGETSVGKYPVQAVQMMAQVAREAEAALPYETMIREKALQTERQTEDAIAYDACRTAFQLHASLIIAFTESGSTADRVSKYRPQPPVLVLTHDQRVNRRLTLRWGVMPVSVPVIETVEEFFSVGEQEARKIGLVESGSLVVLVAGLPIGLHGSTNLLRVLTIGGEAGLE